MKPEKTPPKHPSAEELENEWVEAAAEAARADVAVYTAIQAKHKAARRLKAAKLAAYSLRRS